MSEDLAARLRKVNAKIEELHVLQERLDALLFDLDEILDGGSQVTQAEHAFASAWGARYAGGQPQYAWTKTKDRPAIKRLLRTLGLAEFTARAARYLENNEPFYVNARHPFALFVTSINRHVAEPKGPLFEGGKPTGCTHQPACRSDVEHTTKLRAETRR